MTGRLTGPLGQDGFALAALAPGILNEMPG